MAVRHPRRPVRFVRPRLEDRSLPNSLTHLIELSLLGPAVLPFGEAVTGPPEFPVGDLTATRLAAETTAPAPFAFTKSITKLNSSPTLRPDFLPPGSGTPAASVASAGRPRVGVGAGAADLSADPLASLFASEEAVGPTHDPRASTVPSVADGNGLATAYPSGVGAGSAIIAGAGSTGVTPSAPPSGRGASDPVGALTLFASPSQAGPSAAPQGSSPLAVDEPYITLTAPSAVPVNADDDNGSAVTNGIPTQRDFSVAPFPAGKTDPDLLKATVAWGLPAGGAWSVSISSNPAGAAGKISLWTDQAKTAAYTSPAANGGVFYIEGVHESSASGDVTLQFTYTAGANTYKSGAQSITVTPFVTTGGLSVTPSADAGDPTGQNIVFENGTNGNSGLTARTPKGTLGATDKATALMSGLSGGLKFIQNVSGLVNGNHGTKNAAGVAVGWLFQDQTGQKINLLHGGYPILDTAFGFTDQTYSGGFTSTTNADGTVSITATDSPTTGFPVPGAASGIVDDVLFQFRVYLVVQWKQVVSNSLGAAVPVYYFFANTNWQTDFYGKAVNGPPVTGPITKIQVLDGVTSDATFSRSNLEPPVTALDLNRYFNAEARWAAV